MTVRQVAWRWCYEGLARLVRGPEWAFMNYGYAPLTDEPPPALEPGDAADLLCIQLYRHVLDGVDVTGADVLEVGSGRGGGASWVARYLRPRTVTGVELSV